MERFHWVVRLSPVVVSLVLAWLWIAGGPSPVPDLRLSAPTVARPDRSIGLRAWLLEEDDLGGVSVAAPEVRIELRDGAERVVAETSLSRSHVEGREGRLKMPSDLDGKYMLVATSNIGGHEVSVRRALYVREAIESKLEAGRTVNAFQAYTLEPLRRIEPDRAPPELDPRLEEGACAPGLRCTLSVWVGRWEGRVRARALTGARMAPEPPKPVHADGGFARFEVTVEGPEARVLVEAVGDDDEVLAVRSVRLPIVPGAMVVESTRRGEDVVLSWQSIDGRASVLVDVFEAHRWVDALSLAPDDPVVRGLLPGVWRLQLRRDLFSANTGGVALIAVPDDTPALSMAAEHVLSSGNERGLDPMAMAVVEGELDGNTEAAVRALFAIPAFGVVALGTGVSARVGVDEAAERVQAKRRVRAAALILVVGLLVSLTLFRLEVLAQRRANRVLELLASGDADGSYEAGAGRGLWALVLLVFGVIAMLALSKGWF